MPQPLAVTVRRFCSPASLVNTRGYVLLATLFHGSIDSFWPVRARRRVSGANRAQSTGLRGRERSACPAARVAAECGLLPDMRLSTDRILVSHTGNLPRPDALNRLIDIGEGPSPTPRLIDHYAFHQRLPRAVDGIVDRQIELGVDIVNDGEYVKAGSYGGYIHERLTGFEWQPYDPIVGPKRAPPSGRDALAFPGNLRFGPVVRRRGRSDPTRIHDARQPTTGARPAFGCAADRCSTSASRRLPRTSRTCRPRSRANPSTDFCRRWVR